MMRLDKYLAHAKVGTRKEVKKMIRKGLVEVNHVVCKDDDYKVLTSDQIYVNQMLIEYQTYYYVMLNKPSGYISSTIDEQYPSVLHLIDEVYANDLFPVGRLDVDTEGLLLLTNDGHLAHDLLSPRKHVNKKYLTHLERALKDVDKQTLENGVYLDDELIKPVQIDRITERQVYITIQEGKYHQVKRMFHCVHNEVIYLKRVAMKDLYLDENLDIGEYRELEEYEIAALKGVTL